LNSLSRKDFENFLSGTGIQVYQAELYKGSIQSIQHTAKEAQKAADKARRYIPWKGLLKVGDRKAIVLQKDIKQADQKAGKAEKEAKKAEQIGRKEGTNPGKRKGLSKNEKEIVEEEVEFVLTNQSEKPTKKPWKRRAIPRKEIEKGGRNRLELEGLEEVREPGNTRPAFAFGDLFLPHPFDLVDAPPIDPFLLQEEFIYL
jgi:hypothetical protein